MTLFSIVALAGCSSFTRTPPACGEVVEYSAGPVNVSGYEGFDCAVSFHGVGDPWAADGGTWATTIIKARTLPAGAAPAAPTLPDSAACADFGTKPEDALGCSALSGPQANVCRRNRSCLSVKFTGAAALDLEPILGGPGPYDVEVVCGGVLVLARSGSSRVGQPCGF